MKTFEQLRKGDKVYNVVFNYNTYESTLSELVITDYNLLTKETRYYYDRPYGLEEYEATVEIAHFKLNNNFNLKLDIDKNRSSSAYGKEIREPGQGVSTFYSTSIDKAKEYIRHMLDQRLNYEIKERDKHNQKIDIINKEYSKWSD